MIRPAHLAQQLGIRFTEKYADERSGTLSIHGAPPEFESSFDDLCDGYAQSSPQECADVRAEIAQILVLQLAFLGNSIRAIGYIRSLADKQWLIRALPPSLSKIAVGIIAMICRGSPSSM